MMKRLAANRRPRRKPFRSGNGGELWKVVSRIEKTGGDLPVGYLVTTAPNDRPVAFVPKVSVGSLKMAASIRRDHSKAATANDLRACTDQSFPQVLIGRLLIPVNCDGRAVTRRCFNAGMYRPYTELGPAGPNGWSKVTERVGLWLLEDHFVSDLKKQARAEAANRRKSGASESREGKTVAA